MDCQYGRELFNGLTNLDGMIDYIVLNKAHNMLSKANRKDYLERFSGKGDVD